MTFVAAVALTRYVSLGSILVVVELLAGVILYGQLGKWGMTGAPLYELYALTAFLTLMALYRHRANMKRLLSGTERKIGERAK